MREVEEVLPDFHGGDGEGTQDLDGECEVMSDCVGVMVGGVRSDSGKVKLIPDCDNEIVSGDEIVIKRRLSVKISDMIVKLKDGACRKRLMAKVIPELEKEKIKEIVMRIENKCKDEREKVEKRILVRPSEAKPSEAKHFYSEDDSTEEDLKTFKFEVFEPVDCTNIVGN